MFRVIVNGVSFYTTEKRIKDRSVGSDSNLNEAIYQLYSNLFNATGIATTTVVYDSKMKRHSYDIQINR
jgi:type I restriction-modification system DNA methylase subunit